MQAKSTESYNKSHKNWEISENFLVNSLRKWSDFKKDTFQKKSQNKENKLVSLPSPKLRWLKDLLEGLPWHSSG